MVFLSFLDDDSEEDESGSEEEESETVAPATDKLKELEIKEK